MARPLAFQIDNYLRGRGSPMAGLGNRFVQAGNRYGVDPRLLVGIGTIETGAGQHLANPYSFANWGVHQNVRYKNFGEAIDALAQGLNKGYISQGLVTPQQIVKRYAPGSDGNDEGNWASVVSSVMGEIGNGAGWTQRSPTRRDPRTPPQPTGRPGVDQMTGATKKQIGIAALGQIASGWKPTEALSQYSKGLRQIANIQTPPGSKNVSVHQEAPGPINPNAQNIVALAKEYLGTPYSWGGGGPGGPSRGFGRGANTVGFDCSSFLQFLWAKQGVSIPRTTQTQIKAGRPVSIMQMQPGDAIYFGTKADPHHVGMYIGNGQYIQAPKTGDVIKISALSDRNDIVGIRRFGKVR